MMTPTANAPDHPAGVGYETPPAAQAAERHGPFHLVRQQGGGVRITGAYRIVWGRWRRGLRFAAALGLGLLLFGTVVDAVLGRTVLIDLRRWPPVFTGSAATLLGLALLVLSIVAWLLFRALTWRRLHRLEIDAAPDELIVRQVLPGGEQLTGRWRPADVARLIAEPYHLTIEPHAGQPLKLTIGGSWTAPFWLAERTGEATGIATTFIGREQT